MDRNTITDVVWDWNGTLLDDVELCLQTLNGLMSERSLGSIDRDTYRAHFDFPVRKFYEHLGFDLRAESFEAISHTFVSRYRARAAQSALHADVHATLQTLGRLGVRQHVVSAMESTMLTTMLRDHAITPHLEHVRGLDHIHATSKVDLGVSLIAQLPSRPEQVLFIGDTLHDHETAAAMGCRCVLFAGGHQTPERLQRAGVPVIAALTDVEQMFQRPVPHQEGIDP